METIESSSPNQAALIAFTLLPIHVVLPHVIIEHLLQLLLPGDRIELSHCCHFYRDLIVSPRGLSDLWLYIYHIPQKVLKRQRNKGTINFVPHSIFSSNQSDDGRETHDGPMESPVIGSPAMGSPVGPSPSHATSLPNTLATSTAMSSRQISRQQSVQSLFGTTKSTQSDSPQISPITKLSRLTVVAPQNINDINGMNDMNEPNDVHNNSIADHLQTPNDVDDVSYSPVPQCGTPSSTTSISSSSEGITTLEKGNSSSDSTFSSNDPLLEHPSNPTLTSKIIYWPNYKEVLACDFPSHWKRRNPFYQNLCILGKNCGGAHVRVFEIGVERLPQILSRISPMLLSLCFLNIHRINLDRHAFS